MMVAIKACKSKNISVESKLGFSILGFVFVNLRVQSFSTAAPGLAIYNIWSMYYESIINFEQNLGYLRYCEPSQFFPLHTIGLIFYFILQEQEPD